MPRNKDAQGARRVTFFNTIVLNRCRSLLVQRREISTEHEQLFELAVAIAGSVYLQRGDPALEELLEPDVLSLIMIGEL